jgi:hypothetical protein
MFLLSQFNQLSESSVCRQRKQVFGSEGTVVGWAGTLLLCALAIILFLSFYQFSFVIAWSLFRLCLTARQ